MFALLKDLKLPDSDAKAKAGQLFKTTLAKSLLSSPMAALQTVRIRLKRLDAATTQAPADTAAPQELEPLLTAIEPADFSKYQRRLQLGSRVLVNISGAKPPGHLSSQLRCAVERANTYLRTCSDQWTARMQPELEAQRDRLKLLRGRQKQQLELSYVKDQRPQQIKEKGRLAEQKAIDGRFNDHGRFVHDVMTIDPAPNLKLVAVLHREP